MVCLEDWQMVPQVQSSEDILVGGQMGFSEDVILVSGRKWPREDTIFICDYWDPFHQFKKTIFQMSRMFANGPGDWVSIPGQVIPKT